MVRQLGVCAGMLWLDKPLEWRFLPEPAVEWILEQDS